MSKSNPQNKKASWEKMKTANVLGIMFGVFSFIFLFLLCFKEIPQGNVEIVSLLTGVIIGTGIGGVVSYFFNYKKDQKNYIDGDYNETDFCHSCGKSKNLKDG
tara:strand:+ start:530 stop:838 length:309 start_codon:yes stop_codon:yes gene_type:complete